MFDVVKDLRQYLIDNEVVDASSTFGYEMPDTFNTGNNYNIALLEVSDDPNPRFTRNELAISIQVMASNRANMRVAREKINEIFYFLVGKPAIYIDNNSYYNFNSTVAPRLVGYRENSKPFFTCSLSLVRESQVDEGNRETIC